VGYLGDTSGDGNIQLNDATLANNVGNPATGGGFSAYSKVDPIVLADTDGSGIVDSSSVGNIASLAIGHAQANIPTPPAGRITASGGADPDLSLPGQVKTADGLVEVPVNLNTAMPVGSTGLTEATIDLTYDPRALSVSAADVHLGTLPSLGTGWTVSSVVNQAAGQIVIQLYSMTPLTATSAGSLVTVDFHTLPGAQGTGSVSLVDWANPTGQVWFRTSLSDTNGALTLGNSTGLVSILGLGTQVASAVENAIIQSAPVLVVAMSAIEEDRSVTAEHGQPTLEMATEGVTEGAAPVQTPAAPQVVALQTLVPVIAPVQVLQIVPPGTVIASLGSIRQQIMEQAFKNQSRGTVAANDQNMMDTFAQRTQPTEDLNSQLWSGMDWLATSQSSTTTEDGQADVKLKDDQGTDGAMSIQAVDDYFAILGEDFDME
jgi:hypothetical protein